MDDDKSVVEEPNDTPAAEEMNGIMEYKEYEQEMDTSDEEVSLFYCTCCFDLEYFKRFSNDF